MVYYVKYDANDVVVVNMLYEACYLEFARYNI